MSDELTVRRLRELLHYNPETGELRWLVDRGRAKVGNIAGTLADNGYRIITVDGIEYRAHRLAYFYMTGAWPTKQIDHINLGKDDNRWTNLREASQSQNNWNIKANIRNSTGFKGVSFHKGARKFQAVIKLNRKSVHLGYFASADLAHAAYCEAAIEMHGQFARVS